MLGVAFGTTGKCAIQEFQRAFMAHVLSQISSWVHRAWNKPPPFHTIQAYTWQCAAHMRRISALPLCICKKGWILNALRLIAQISISKHWGEVFHLHFQSRLKNRKHRIHTAINLILTPQGSTLFRTAINLWQIKSKSVVCRRFWSNFKYFQRSAAFRKCLRALSCVWRKVAHGAVQVSFLLSNRSSCHFSMPSAHIV